MGMPHAAPRPGMEKLRRVLAGWGILAALHAARLDSARGGLVWVGARGCTGQDALVGGCCHRGLGDPPGPVAPWEGSSRQQMLCRALGYGSSFMPGLGPCAAPWCRDVGSRHMSVPGSWAPLPPSCHSAARCNDVVPSGSPAFCVESRVWGGKERRGHTGVSPYLNSAWGIPQLPGALTEGREEGRGKLGSWVLGGGERAAQLPALW